MIHIKNKLPVFLFYLPGSLAVTAPDLPLFQTDFEIDEIETIMKKPGVLPKTSPTNFILKKY